MAIARAFCVESGICIEDALPLFFAPVLEVSAFCEVSASCISVLLLAVVESDFQLFK